MGSGLQKTDGQKKTRGGAESYILYFEAKARVLHLQERCFTPAPVFNPEHVCGWTEWPRASAAEDKEGKEYPISGHLIFEKRESGWVPVVGSEFSRGYKYKIVNE